MKKLTHKEFRGLFNGLCCSRCKNDFDIEDLEIREEYGDLMICSLKCKKCDKDFGEIILNFNKKARAHTELKIIDGPPVINCDDVIDAHEFIKKHLR